MLQGHGYNKSYMSLIIHYSKSYNMSIENLSAAHAFDYIVSVQDYPWPDRLLATVVDNSLLVPVTLAKFYHINIYLGNKSVLLP